VHNDKTVLGYQKRVMDSTPVPRERRSQNREEEQSIADDQARMTQNLRSSERAQFKVTP